MRGYDESPLSMGMIGIGIVLVLVGAAMGYWLSNSGMMGNDSSAAGSLTESDKTFLAGLVGTGIVQFSDKLCEKHGLKSDLLPQVATISDANGTPIRQVQYFVPVCVA